MTTWPYVLFPGSRASFKTKCFVNEKSMPVLLALQWRHTGCDGVSNHQPHDWLLNRLFRRRSKKTSKLRVTGLCVVNSPVTGEFPAQRDSNAENVSVWWRHHVDNVTHLPRSEWSIVQTVRSYPERNESSPERWSHYIMYTIWSFNQPSQEIQSWLYRKIFGFQTTSFIPTANALFMFNINKSSLVSRFSYFWCRYLI